MSSALAAITPNVQAFTPAAQDAWFERKFAESMARLQAEKTPTLSIMVTKGTLDWAYPPFIIGSTAAAMGWEVTMFFTFYGLALLKKDLKLHISPLGNPAVGATFPEVAPWQVSACRI